MVYTELKAIINPSRLDVVELYSEDGTLLEEV